MGFPDGLDGKESTCIAGELSSIPGSGRSPGEGNGYSIIYLSICIFGHIMLDLSSLTRIELRPLTVKARRLSRPLDHQGIPRIVYFKLV